MRVTASSLNYCFLLPFMSFATYCGILVSSFPATQVPASVELPPPWSDSLWLGSHSSAKWNGRGRPAVPPTGSDCRPRIPQGNLTFNKSAREYLGLALRPEDRGSFEDVLSWKVSLMRRFHGRPDPNGASSENVVFSQFINQSTAVTLDSQSLSERIHLDTV